MSASATVVEPKPGVDMGRLTVEIDILNYEDWTRAESGQIPAEQVRRTKVESLVDSGATFMCLPRSIIDSLGLRFHYQKEARTVTGPVSLGIFGMARIEVQGRHCVTEVMELPEDRIPLLGQVPLEIMDWWIDLRQRRLVGNPEHGGQWMAEVF